MWEGLFWDINETVGFYNQIFFFCWKRRKIDIMKFDMNYDDKHHGIHKFLGKLRLKNVSQSDEVKGDGFE